MKRKEINDKVKVNGYYVNEFTRGFLGEQDEGNWMLEQMGLQSGVVPFSVITFFQNKQACWKDKNSNTASISFKLKPNQIECFGSYLKKKKTIRIFREWGWHENPEVIARLESEAIGDLCMKCIYENLIA
ncbi:hypothetical protein [Bacteroides caccae]|uniref:hypothetical protein n=1 Tax=Bacteroides caccae TaxID=47678 RepID=UPI003565E947